MTSGRRSGFRWLGPSFKVLSSSDLRFRRWQPERSIERRPFGQSATRRAAGSRSAIRESRLKGVARVLVLEDYPPLAKVIAIALRRSGHDVERAGSIQRAKASDGAFDAL